MTTIDEVTTADATDAPSTADAPDAQQAPAFSLDPATTALLDAAEDLLADGVRLDAALGRNAAEIEAAKSSHEAMLIAQTDIDTALALATDEVAAKALEAKVKKATADADVARLLLDRRQRVRGALFAERAKVKAAIEAEIAALEVERRTQAQALIEDLDAELRNALRPVVALLQRAYALQAAVNGQALAMALYEFKVPSLGRGGTHLYINGERHFLDDGTVFLNDWRHDASLVDANTIAGRPLAVVRKLQAYAAQVPGVSLAPAMTAEEFIAAQDAAEPSDVPISERHREDDRRWQRPQGGAREEAAAVAQVVGAR